MDPTRWGPSDVLQRVVRETPSVRGIAYGNYAQAMLAEWLVNRGVPVEDQLRDDDHAKIKSDRTFTRPLISGNYRLLGILTRYQQ
jgi:hypothetical protein